MTAQALAVAYEKARRASASGLRGYLDWVVIDSRPDPRRFSQVARSWQWDRVRRVEGALEALAGAGPEWHGPRAWYEVAPRGYDKTTGVARFINWLLGFSKRPLNIVSASGDAEQAKLLRDAMNTELRLNPWLAEAGVTVRQRTASGPGGELQVLTADAPTSFGQRVDLFCVDEITWWKKRDLWDALWSGFRKMPGACMFVITNAGVQGSWQHKDFLTVKSLAQLPDPTWQVYEAPGQMDTWMSSGKLAEDRLLLPRGLAARVYDNRWVDPAEDGGYLTRAECQQCEDLGREMGLAYRTVGIEDKEYALVVDYGPKRDRTALGVMHQEAETGLLVVDKLDVWQGSPDSPIKVKAIREWIEEQRSRFTNCFLVVDPYQLLELTQDYECHLEVVTWEAHGGKSNYEMAEAFRTAVINKQIAWYPGAGGLLVNGQMETLLDEIPLLVIKQTPYGYRYDHEAGFHDDRAVVVSMGTVTLLNRSRAYPFKKPPEVARSKPEPFRIRKSCGRDLFGLK